MECKVKQILEWGDRLKSDLNRIRKERNTLKGRSVLSSIIILLSITPARFFFTDLIDEIISANSRYQSLQDQSENDYKRLKTETNDEIQKLNKQLTQSFDQLTDLKSQYNVTVSQLNEKNSIQFDQLKVKENQIMELNLKLNNIQQNANIKENNFQKQITGKDQDLQLVLSQFNQLKTNLEQIQQTKERDAKKLLGKELEYQSNSSNRSTLELLQVKDEKIIELQDKIARNQTQLNASSFDQNEKFRKMEEDLIQSQKLIQELKSNSNYQNENIETSQIKLKSQVELIERQRLEIQHMKKQNTDLKNALNHKTKEDQKTAEMILGLQHQIQNLQFDKSKVLMNQADKLMKHQIQNSQSVNNLNTSPISPYGSNEIRESPKLLNVNENLQVNTNFDQQQKTYPSNQPKPKSPKSNLKRSWASKGSVNFNLKPENEGSWSPSSLDMNGINSSMANLKTILYGDSSKSNGNISEMEMNRSFENLSFDSYKSTGNSSRIPSPDVMGPNFELKNGKEPNESENILPPKKFRNTNLSVKPIQNNFYGISNPSSPSMQSTTGLNGSMLYLHTNTFGGSKHTIYQSNELKGHNTSDRSSPSIGSRANIAIENHPRIQQPRSTNDNEPATFLVQEAIQSNKVLDSFDNQIKDFEELFQTTVGYEDQATAFPLKVLRSLYLGSSPNHINPQQETVTYIPSAKSYPPIRSLFFTKQKRILVTGGAGFVGSHLVDRLMKMGHLVTVIDNFYTVSTSYLKLLDPYLMEVDQIYHLACPASPPHYQYNAVKTIKTSVMGTLNMLGMAKRTKARFLFTSTSACYDEGKRVAETLTYAYANQDKVDVRVVRIFNTFGPRMNPEDGRVVSNFIIQALQGKPLTIYGDGQQTSLIDGLILAMNGSYSQPINLGNPVEYTISQFAEMIVKKINPSLEITYLPAVKDDPKKRKPDITRAKREIGWEPQFSTEQGIEETIEYFKLLLASSA
ncbi:UDP-glucuronic acid decarboxylase 1 [Globomyces sp. JEL0801]|nr:UDP-glucuronic acid decarboxylase 1 [Globomyces sp. JEL0801]